MKLYEISRICLEPVLPPLYKTVRRRLNRILREFSGTPDMLDVGGRKSPYTIGLDSRITILDLPRESEIQMKLGLGVNEHIIGQVKRMRSNVKNVLLGDMTKSDLPDNSFDVVVSVEVLEHVEEDGLFVSEVSRVLKPGGVFLMTTPNGDWVENKNPDHKRHYRKEQLESLLKNYFDEVQVDYAILGGKYRKMGLKSWSMREPATTAKSMFGNIVNGFQSVEAKTINKSAGTHHLIATARIDTN